MITHQVFVLPSDNVSYMIWSNTNRISANTLYHLSYHSETVHIPLSLPKVSTLQLPSLAYPQNILLLVNAPPIGTT